MSLLHTYVQNFILPVGSETFCRIRNKSFWIRIRAALTLNDFETNFSDKVYNFSTKCTIKMNKKKFFQKISRKSLGYKNISIVTDRCETLSRRKPALPDPKQDPDPESEPKLSQKSDPDPESDPKQIIPDPHPCFFSTFSINFSRSYVFSLSLAQTLPKVSL